jgi:hypothetical protein
MSNFQFPTKLLNVKTFKNWTLKLFIGNWDLVIGNFMVLFWIFNPAICICSMLDVLRLKPAI